MKISLTTDDFHTNNSKSVNSSNNNINRNIGKFSEQQQQVATTEDLMDKATDERAKKCFDDDDCDAELSNCNGSPKQQPQHEVRQQVPAMENCHQGFEPQDSQVLWEGPPPMEPSLVSSEDTTSSNNKINNNMRELKQQQQYLLQLQQKHQQQEQEQRLARTKRKNDRSNPCWGSMRLLRQFRMFCGSIVNNESFQTTVILLIVINAIFMGIGTFGFAHDILNTLDLIDKIFLIIFTIELVIQAGYHGYGIFTDGWLCFDFLIVVLSWSLESVQVFRSFRVFRAIRLVARLDALRQLVGALFMILPDFCAISLMLALILYIFSVMCTVLFKDLYDEGVIDYPYFDDLWKSFFTLFQLLTLDSWSPIVRQIMKEYPWAWGVFSGYITLSSFMLYSLVAAVLCNAILVQDEEQQDDIGKENREIVARIKELEEKVDSMIMFQHELLLTVQLAMHQIEQEEESGVGNDRIDDDDDDMSLNKLASQSEYKHQHQHDHEHRHEHKHEDQQLIEGSANDNDSVTRKLLDIDDIDQDQDTTHNDQSETDFLQAEFTRFVDDELKKLLT